MAAVAHLEDAEIALVAGEEMVVPLQIRNTGELVEAYDLEVVGPAGAWSLVTPATVSLYPGTAATATVAFRPPRSPSVPAGDLPFGVRVVPTDHPEETVVPEGVVQVLPFLDTSAELTPRTSRGRLQGRHDVAVDNRGNVAVSCGLEPLQAGELLRFRLAAADLTAEPGTAAFADLRVRPRRLLWRGQPVTHPFQVGVLPDGGEPVTLDGTWLQEPVLPKWLPKALLALLLLAGLLALAWFLLLRPTIQASAQEAAEEVATQALAAPAAQAADQAQQAEQAADQAKSAAATSAKNAGESRTIYTKIAGAGPAEPVSERLAVTTSPGEAGTASYAVPAKQTLGLTDLVVENPQGDFGTVAIVVAGRVQFEFALENFRSIDYHFVAPIPAGPGTTVELRATCRSPGRPPGLSPPPSQCSTGAFIGGELRARG